MQLNSAVDEQQFYDDLMDKLILERIRPATRFAFFGTTGEGRYLPGTRAEEYSGYVLDDHGRVHFFWFGWDKVSAAPALTMWIDDTHKNFADDKEYRSARERLGLAPIA